MSPVFSKYSEAPYLFVITEALLGINAFTVSLLSLPCPTGISAIGFPIGSRSITCSPFDSLQLGVNPFTNPGSFPSAAPYKAWSSWLPSVYAKLFCSTVVRAPDLLKVFVLTRLISAKRYAFFIASFFFPAPNKPPARPIAPPTRPPTAVPIPGTTEAIAAPVAAPFAVNPNVLDVDSALTSDSICLLSSPFYTVYPTPPMFD